MRALTALFLLAAPVAAAAQPAQPYAPPDRELWDLMARALDDMPMSMQAHQQVQQILANVQREAQMREARTKAKPPAEKE